MTNPSLLDYMQLAKRFYADLNVYTQTQTETDLYKKSDKVNTTYLKANIDSLGDVVFGLQQDGYADKATALVIAVENVRRAVKNHDNGKTTGTEVKVHVAHLIKQLTALCRPTAPQISTEPMQNKQTAIENKQCWHNPDFTSVVWYGIEYCFNKTQGKIINYLWQNETATEIKLGEIIGTAAGIYRLKDTFRNKEGYHCAWGKMIVKAGKGCFMLNKS